MAIILEGTQQFLLSNVPPVMRFIDNTDYSGAGAEHDDTIIGLLQVYDPSGAILYQNSHYGDTTPSSGDLVPYASVPVTFIDIALPVDPTTNLPEQGNYTVNYRVYVDQASGSSLNGNYTLQKIYNVCPVIPKVCIEVSVDCICGKYSSVDATNYGAYDSLTRVHTVKYPGGVPLSPEVSSLANITAALYTGTYTSIISSTVTYGALTFIVTGSVEEKISCAKSLCDVSCQIFKLQDAYFEALKCDTTMARQYKCQLDEITLLMQGISMAMDCGQTDRINELLERVYRVGHFTPDGCGCSGDDTPRLVSGCGNVITGNTYSVTTSNGLTVFTVTSGSNTEFQLKLNDGLYNVLNGLTKSAFTAGSNITITPVTSPDGATVTYTIASDVSGATLTIAQITDLQTILDGKQTIDLTNGNVLIGNSSNIAAPVSISGDISITNGGVVTVSKINGATLGTTTATSGNILVANGSSTWVSVAMSGDTTISNSGVVTLKNTGTAGTYTSVTTDAQGRITGGTNPGFITGNQSITFTGDVTGSGTTGVTLTIANGAVVAANMASNSVATAAIQNGAITTAKYASASIPTAAYESGSVTGGASGVIADGTITEDNIATSFLTDFWTQDVSFDEDGLGTIGFFLPFTRSITIISIRAIVTETIAGTDSANIQATSSTGNLSSGGISIPSSSAAGYTATPMVIVGNTVVAPGTLLSITGSKTTAGGKALVTISYVRN